MANVVWGFLQTSFDRHPESLLFDEQKQIRYMELCELVIDHAHKISDALQEKSKCAILCRKGINTAIAVLSCWCANMVPIILTVNYGANKNKEILELASPTLLISDSLELIEKYNFFSYNIDNSKFSGHLKTVSLEKGLSDIACILYTSGTTGRSKGVLISCIALITNVKLINTYFGSSEKERIVISRPLYHCGVLTAEFLVSFINGVDIGFLDSKYNPSKVLDFIQKNRICIICGTPTLLYYLSSLIIKRGLTTSIKKVACSGECLNKACAEVIRRGFPTAKVFNAYGLTEAAPRVTYLPSEKFDEHYDSVGIPLPGITIKIVGNDGSELPFYNQGEVFIKTPCLMKGYYNDMELTKKTIQGDWLKTGDIGYKDESGYLYILARIDDMIIKGGMNIYPAEIENAVLSLAKDYIDDCVAYAHKNKVSEEVVLDVVLNDKANCLSAKEIMDVLSRFLPSYQLPSELNIVRHIERTSSGKKIRPKADK